MEPPIEPLESDCCNSGCNPCILDIYEEQLKKYNQMKTQEKSQIVHMNCILPTAYTVFTVNNIEPHCKDAVFITFEYSRFIKQTDHGNDMKPLKVMFNPGQYLMLKTGPTNQEFQRPYTPLPIENADSLKFTVLIKLYEIGQMSSYIRKLKFGSNTIWRGPYGNFSINYSYKHILFIAQGVGITSLYGIICDIIKQKDCDSFLKLYFCCKSFDTIYLRNKLYSLQSNWNFSYELFLSNPENIDEKYNETVHKAKLEVDVLKTYLKDKVDNMQVLICGNEHFMQCFKEIVIYCKVDEKNIVLF
ncbi:NADH-cytochrome b5 reductase-like [Diabrotica undecimpunctata]|uniref:NADH-cytochrome b5 reductase-like n=1 Tax=Diabrotica undecimpunctata TaxID=50387 RepID=UPI003B637CC7